MTRQELRAGWVKVIVRIVGLTLTSHALNTGCVCGLPGQPKLQSLKIEHLNMFRSLRRVKTVAENGHHGRKQFSLNAWVVVPHAVWHPPKHLGQYFFFSAVVKSVIYWVYGARCKMYTVLLHATWHDFTEQVVFKTKRSTAAGMKCSQRWVACRLLNHSSLRLCLLLGRESSMKQQRSS